MSPIWSRWNAGIFGVTSLAMCPNTIFYIHPIHAQNAKYHQLTKSMSLSAYIIRYKSALSFHLLRLLNSRSSTVALNFDHPRISPIPPHPPLSPVILARSRLHLGRDGIGLSLFREWLSVCRIDFQEVVEDDKKHGGGTEEEGQAVELLVCYHFGRWGVYVRVTRRSWWGLGSFWSIRSWFLCAGLSGRRTDY